MKQIAWTRWLREPLLQFLAIGALLFLANAALQSDPAGDESAKVIELTQGDLKQIQATWMLKWQREPTPKELAGLVAARVREEILYREALALGLDQGDEIIRRRLAQKMDFLLGDMATVEVPTTAMLEQWYAENTDLFRQDGRLSFRHLYFSPDLRGGFAGARTAAEAALLQLLGEGAGAETQPGLADRFMFQEYYADRTTSELATTFGPAFADKAFALAQGSWQGPLESGLGWHLVWVVSMTPSRVPDFFEIEPEVEQLWLAEQREAAKAREMEALWSSYEIVLPASAAGSADAGSD